MNDADPYNMLTETAATQPPAETKDRVLANREVMNLTDEERGIIQVLTEMMIRHTLDQMIFRDADTMVTRMSKNLVDCETKLIQKVRAYKAGTTAPVLN